MYLVKYVHIKTSEIRFKEIPSLLEALLFMKKIRKGGAQAFLFTETNLR